MPRMDLKQNYRDGNGVLYRAGRDREIPQSLYDALNGAPPQREDKKSVMPHAEVLAGAGFSTPEAVRDASDEELLAIEGIGPARLAEIRSFK